MNLVSLLRCYLIYLLFNIGGWIYFGFLLYYTSYITTENCISYTKELTDVVKIFVGISMSITTINLGSATNSIFNNDTELIFKNLLSTIVTTTMFLTISSINSFAIFSITSGMTDIRCSNNNAEIGLKLSVYGVIWIIFIEILLILLAIIIFISNVIVNAKLHLLCTSCFNIFKKYKERRIGIEPSSVPEYNTNHISIPMPVAALKEEPKLLCSICLDNAITLLIEPCNHICICDKCNNSLVTKECPICRTNISATRKIYFANTSY